jgi:hypothetical protein
MGHGMDPQMAQKCATVCHGVPKPGASRSDLAAGELTQIARFETGSRGNPCEVEAETSSLELSANKRENQLAFGAGKADVQDKGLSGADRFIASLRTCSGSHTRPYSCLQVADVESPGAGGEVLCESGYLY